MNTNHLILSLRRPELDYQTKAKEALIHSEDAIRNNNIQFAKSLISEFVFCEKTKVGRLNSTQEIQLVVLLLSDVFAKDDPGQFLFFINLFEPGKKSRQNLLLKFILTAVAIQSSAALNASGAYLLDKSTKEYRISADFGRKIINEITFSVNEKSIAKLKSLAEISPLFVNSLMLIFAETFKEEQMPTPIVRSLITEYVDSSTSPPFMTFSVPGHVDVGALLLGSFFRWTVLSELIEETSSYSKLHLKILECINNVDPSSPAKPVIHTKYLEVIIEHIERAAKVKDPASIQRAVEKFAQIVLASKKYLHGNVPTLVERLSLLPKNSLMDLVIMSLK